MCVALLRSLVPFVMGKQGKRKAEPAAPAGGGGGKGAGGNRGAGGGGGATEARFPGLQIKRWLAPQHLLDSYLFTIPAFMTAKEARGFVDAGEGLGFMPQGSGGAAAGEAYRDNGRVAVQDAALADAIWASGLDAVFRDLAIDVDGCSAVGLNPNIRLYRYVPGQRFGKHIDESVDLAGGRFTAYTLLVYLSGGEGEKEGALKGGETAFYDDYGKLLCKVEPTAGTALLHLHGEDRCLEHEAMGVTQGVKYILRSDVVFG